MLRVLSGPPWVVDIPPRRDVQARRAQTDAAGALTWNFEQPFPAGVMPIVEVAVEDASSSIWEMKIVALSNTAVSIQLSRATVVTVLSVNVLGIAANPQAWVHLTAVAP